MWRRPKKGEQRYSVDRFALEEDSAQQPEPARRPAAAEKQQKSNSHIRKSAEQSKAPPSGDINNPGPQGAVWLVWLLFKKLTTLAAIIFVSAIGNTLITSWVARSSLPLPLRRLFRERCDHATVHIDIPFRLSLWPDTQGPVPFNYAMRQCGAQCIDGLSYYETIPNDDVHAAAVTGKVTANYPELVIGGQQEFCWQFNGGRGQLGIALSDIINISLVSVGHPSLGREQHSPRSMILWGLIDDDEHANVYRNSTRVLHQLHSYLPSALPSLVPDDNMYVPLALVDYNPHAIVTRQYFSVFKEADMLGLPFGIVILQVLDNWGASSTEICHLGIYGAAVQDEPM